RVGVGVVVTRGQGDLTRVDAALVQNLGQHLELRLGAVLGEVAGDDEMLRPRRDVRCERALHAFATFSLIELAEEAQERKAKASSCVALLVLDLEQMQIRQMRYTGHA